VKALSRRALEELGILQAALRKPAEDRNLALRLFAASRNAATRAAQQEFWLEFSWLDQEYRAAVRHLAQFCVDHTDGPRLRAHADP
jgi:hypothetical protein